MADPYELLLNGSVIKANDALYTNAMNGPWWVIGVYIVFWGGIYYATKHEVPAAIYGLLVGAALAYKYSYATPVFQGVIYFMLVINIAIVIFRLFNSR